MFLGRVALGKEGVEIENKGCYILFDDKIIIHPNWKTYSSDLVEFQLPSLCWSLASEHLHRLFVGAATYEGDADHREENTRQPHDFQTSQWWREQEQGTQQLQQSDGERRQQVEEKHVLESS